LNDLDLRLQRSQIALAEDDRLPQPLLFLQDPFPLIVKQPLGRQIPRASETGDQNLGRQFGSLLLQVGFALLQCAPRLVQALGTGYERLHLEFQFDALSPEKFASLHLRISSRLAILGWLVALSLVMSLIAMGLLLIGHERHSFLVLVVLFVMSKRAARK